jgi:GrpB-like predicted nucleotidyltransferase (UPF0157 family)
MITFRDWLRTHPDDLALYEKTKLDLSTKTWGHVQNHADAKNDVVDDILARTRWSGSDRCDSCS